MQKNGPVVAWIVDDTGFPKQGKHSVGVARQYCGQVGKQDNCQVAVSLSVSTWNASLPIAWRLYLPEVWCQDAKRCRQARVPEGVEFQTKPEIALQQIRQALEQQVPVGVILADAGYGHNTRFRSSLTQLGLHYINEARSRRSDGRPKCLLVPTCVTTKCAAGREIQTTTLYRRGEPVGPIVHQRAELDAAFQAGRWIGDFAFDSAAHRDITALASSVVKQQNDR
jgi:SRSO17 transposase